MDINDIYNSCLLNPNPAFVIDYNSEEIIFKNLKAKVLHKSNKYKWDLLVDNIILKYPKEKFFLFETKNNKIYKFIVKKFKNYYYIYSQDITEETKAKQNADFITYHDELTKLPKRNLFIEFIEIYSEQSNRDGYYNGILTLDIDNFQYFNDTYGYNFGDKLLKKISQKLKKTVRKSDYLARIGDDEFGILVPKIETSSNEASFNITLFAKRLQNIFLEPIEIDNEKIYITFCIGLTTFKTQNVHEILKEINYALFKAKQNGFGSIDFFDEKLAREMLYKTKISEHLKLAIKNKEFSLLYHPQVDIKNNKVYGAEVLIRWNNKKLNNIPPSEFIPLAEKNGLINDITYWIIEQTTNDFKVLNNYIDNIAINISSIIFSKDIFLEKLLSTLDKKQISPKHVELELTESVFLNNFEAIKNKIKKLKQLGFKISLDDFGTGYSSLSYIKNLNIDILKIDKSFVDDIEEKKDLKLIEVIVEIAKHFGLKTIVEGVETQKQFNIIKELDCDIIQGYYYAKPMKYNEFLNWLKNFNQ